MDPSFSFHLSFLLLSDVWNNHCEHMLSLDAILEPVSPGILHRTQWILRALIDDSRGRSVALFLYVSRGIQTADDLRLEIT